MIRREDYHTDEVDKDYMEMLFDEPIIGAFELVDEEALRLLDEADRWEKESKSEEVAKLRIAKKRTEIWKSGKTFKNRNLSAQKTPAGKQEVGNRFSTWIEEKLGQWRNSLVKSNQVQLVSRQIGFYQEALILISGEITRWQEEYGQKIEEKAQTRK